MSERIDLGYYRNRNAAIKGMLRKAESELTVTHRWLGEESTERVEILITELEQARRDLDEARRELERVTKAMIEYSQEASVSRERAARAERSLLQAREELDLARRLRVADVAAIEALRTDLAAAHRQRDALKAAVKKLDDKLKIELQFNARMHLGRIEDMHRREAAEMDLAAAQERATKAKRARDHLIERSKELTQCKRDRDHWCTDALEQTVRADKAEAALAAAQERADLATTEYHNIEQAWDTYVEETEGYLEAERDRWRFAAYRLKAAFGPLKARLAAAQERAEKAEQDRAALRGFFEVLDDELPGALSEVDGWLVHGVIDGTFGPLVYRFMEWAQEDDGNQADDTIATLTQERDAARREVEALRKVARELSVCWLTVHLVGRSGDWPGGTGHW